MNTSLPSLALSVRQPWAWAIIHGGKTIENRSLGAIRAGRMVPCVICIHASSGMTEKEYRYGQWRLAQHGVACPRPDMLIRGGIIGTVEVTGVVTQSDSEWFGGEAGLGLKDPRATEPVAAAGALGYFEWSQAADFAPVKPWMRRFDTPGGDSRSASLFPDEPPSYKAPPGKPWSR